MPRSQRPGRRSWAQSAPRSGHTRSSWRASPRTQRPKSDDVVCWSWFSKWAVAGLKRRLISCGFWLSTRRKVHQGCFGGARSCFSTSGGLVFSRVQCRGLLRRASWRNRWRVQLASTVRLSICPRWIGRFRSCARRARGGFFQVAKAAQNKNKNKKTWPGHATNQRFCSLARVGSAKNKTAGISNPASEIQVQYGTHTPAMVQFPSPSPPPIAAFGLVNSQKLQTVYHRSSGQGFVPSTLLKVRSVHCPISRPQ